MKTIRSTYCDLLLLLSVAGLSISLVRAADEMIELTGQSKPLTAQEQSALTSYKSKLASTIKNNWKPPLDGGLPRVGFTATGDEKVSKLRLERTSRSALSDEAAIKAVTSAFPIDPLPVGIEAVHVSVRFDDPESMSVQARKHHQLLSK